VGNYDKNRAVNALLDSCAEAYGPRDIFRWRTGEDVLAKSYAAFAGEARTLACALAAATPPKARIAILGENSYAWLLCWFAAVCAGRTAVPLDAALPTADALALLQKSGAVLLFFGTGYNDVAADFAAAAPQNRSVALADLPAFFAEIPAPADWPCAPQPEDLAAIVFTSGTTGEPKGVPLSHWNLLSTALSGCRCEDMANHTMLAVLPFHHTISLTPGMLAQLPGGSTVCIGGGIKRLPKDMEVFRPEYTMVVPLLAEGMYRKIWDTARKQGKEQLLRRMLRLSDGLRRVGIDLRRRLFRNVLAALGGEMIWMLCGGAAVSDDCVTGFSRLGVEILPAYGISECGPGISVSSLAKHRLGSVGQVLDCCEVRVDAPDADGVGEILVRGDNVFGGYLEEEAATQDAFTDGWFRTGDLGKRDRDGYLYITGRLKNLIILSNGKNVSPEPLEQRLLELDYVKEVLVYDDAGEIAAELYLDETDPGAAARLPTDLLAINRQLPAYERITKTILRETEFPKTTTKKIKRK
jgi:long-chain acyl-CoA synthetase